MKGRRFDGSLALAVSCRCRWGYPQVLLCDPLGRKGPFPTSFWLTCPHLDRVAALLEAQGGVRELEVFLEAHRDRWRAYQVRQVLFRQGLLGRRGTFLRRFRPAFWQGLCGGVGGIRLGRQVHVKCLHLQAAYWLGQGDHPAAAWLAERLKPLSCDDPENRPCGGGFS
ncbi:MAG: DUF501 domain-containing protein [Synergistaceae bacterium]|nr:DUF501 domain-containing protein [Synergistaceae bacterium]